MKNKELEKIRNKRKALNKINDKTQKRKVEIIEHENGTYSLIGFAYTLPLQKNEMKDAFESWLDGSLENGKDIGIKFN